MFGRRNGLLAAAVVAVAVLVVPPAALAACKTGVSAVNVYKECLQTGSGGKATGGSANGGTNTGGTGSTSVPISQQTRKALKKAGADGQSLKYLLRASGARSLQSHSSTAKTPTAIGSAFDLGSGPTVLLIVLAGTALIMFAAGGFRSARQRRR